MQAGSALDPEPEAGAGSDADEDTVVEVDEASTGVAEGRDPSTIGNVEDPGAGSAMASEGCGSQGQPMTGARSVAVGAVTRTFVLDVPSAYDGVQPQPLVFAFHGATTSGEFFRSRFYGNLLSTMGEEAIVVHPDALGDPTQWNNADIPFFDALLAALESELCIDRERIFATGHSSGGFFTNTLGCQRGDVLRAIAPVSAGGPFVFGGAGCTGEVAVWIAHAENDETVAFENGVASRDRWLEANACDADAAPAATTPAPCQEYVGCAPGLPVRWCVYQDGHDWPQFAPEGIWQFFSSL